MEKQMTNQNQLELEFEAEAQDNIDREKESYQVERYEIERSQKPTPISLWVQFCDSVEDFN
jgi:hypothetical protein